MKTLFIILLLYSLQLEATPHLRALIVADIRSSDIREGTRRDYQRMQENIKNIANQLQISHTQTTLIEKNYTPDEIRKWIKTIQKGEIVLFYYSGHGFRPSRKSNPWPVLTCKKVITKKSYVIPGKEICFSIKKKEPRLSLIFFDCCNDPLHIKSPQEESPQFIIPEEPYLPGLTSLFLKLTGSVTACAASPGQPALTLIGGRTTGSLFSLSLIFSLLEEGKQIGTSWSHVLERTIPDIDSISSGRQRPFYNVDVRPDL
jgi:hypothetical protein